MIIVNIWVIEWNNEVSKRLTQFRIHQAMPPQNTGGQACTSSVTEKRSVHVDVGDDNHTNARMQTCHYSVCIWYSWIARSACFAFDSCEGELAPSVRATRQFEQAGSMIIWWLFDDYLMIIWWLFDDYLLVIRDYSIELFHQYL